MKFVFPTILFVFLTFMACKPANENFIVKEINESEIVGMDGTIRNLPKLKAGQSTFFLVRHAEKENGKDPGLTSEGQERADRLVEILSKRPLKQVFSTNYRRTELTAAPVAENQAATIGSYNPDTQAVMIRQLLKQGGGYSYLVVGHSNTIPELLNLFAGKEVYELIPENEYDNLYMVVAGESGEAQIFELKY